MIYKQLDIQKTIDLALEVGNEYNLVYGQEIEIFVFNEITFIIGKEKNYYLPFRYKDLNLRIKKSEWY